LHVCLEFFELLLVVDVFSFVNISQVIGWECRVFCSSREIGWVSEMACDVSSGSLYPTLLSCCPLINSPGCLQLLEILQISLNLCGPPPHHRSGLATLPSVGAIP